MKGKHFYFFVLLFLGFIGTSLVTPINTTGIGPYLNGVFPNEPPGEVASWSIEDAYPNISIVSPLNIQPFANTNEHLILGKLGDVWKVSLKNQTQELVLDIKDRCFAFSESGATGMTLHPNFGITTEKEHQVLFIFYRYHTDVINYDERGLNRLSKFYWDETTQTFDENTEEILFQQYDRSTWHNGGALFFGNDGFLYICLGDEGAEEQQKISTQNIDGGFFSGVLRIDVDNDPERSHPVRRQPKALETPPSGWGATFSQGYSIPNDNPWLSEQGAYLEEFYAIGLRSPYSSKYDATTGKVWTADVGSNKREEISVAEKGGNLQWPYIEGDLKSELHEKPDNLIGNDVPPVYTFTRDIGYIIIGGGVYRGNKFPKLYGKYLFGDFGHNYLRALDFQKAEPTQKIIVNKIIDVDAVLPEKPGVSGIHLLPNGDVLFTIMGKDHTSVGRILKLNQKVAIPDPPGKLSSIGAFKDLKNLEVADGIIPYEVIAPLWSDRATKKRWMAIPNNQKIEFNAVEDWKFPEGTVFIKHFDLPLTDEENGPSKKLETRFFVIGKDNKSYGLTYRWNEDGTDATLLKVEKSDNIDIVESNSVAFKQKWDYPGREQCLSCHNKNANYVLGVKTHQLNSEIFYNDINAYKNQVEYLSEKGILDKNIRNANDYSKAYNINDEDADLELRILSYMDSNCAPCHQLGGVTDVSMDLRYQIPLIFHNTINVEVNSQASNQNNKIILPGDHTKSELWLRDSSIDENKMPPLSRNIKDEVYLKYLAQWIDGLSPERAEINQFYCFPNPGSGYFNLRFPDNWSLPVEIKVYNLQGYQITRLQSENLFLPINLTGLASGMYILTVSDGTNIINHKITLW